MFAGPTLEMRVPKLFNSIKDRPKEWEALHFAQAELRHQREGGMYEKPSSSSLRWNVSSLVLSCLVYGSGYQGLVMNTFSCKAFAVPTY